jgi:curli biogenesis system outer membrane secretion channel CsgG
VNSPTAAPIGQVEGADLLIKGSVTECEPGSAGAGAGVGMGGFGWTGAVIGGVLGALRQSHVAMIIQVVDARISRILFSSTVEGQANDFNLGGALAGFGGGFLGAAGLGAYQKTPVEKAIRIAIQHAVKELAAKTPQAYFRYGSETATVAPVSRAVQKISRQPTPASSVAVGAAGLPSAVKFKVSVANLRDAPATQGKAVAT